MDNIKKLGGDIFMMNIFNIFKFKKDMVSKKVKDNSILFSIKESKNYLEESQKKYTTIDKENSKENTEIICPYCNIKLDIIPTRKRRCPLCKNNIMIRISKTGCKILITENQAMIMDWENRLKEYNVLNSEIESVRSQFSAKQNKKANDRDVIWSILNSLVHKNMKLNNFFVLQSLYSDMAYFYEEEGRDNYILLQQVKRTELLKYKNDGVKKVEILVAKDSCDICKKLNKNKINIEKALEILPLPCKECRNEKHGCRCCYLPCID